MAINELLRQPKIEVGEKAWEAKQYIVRAILDEFYDQMGRGIVFDSFFRNFTRGFMQEDFLMRMRSCYSCIGRIAPEIPVVMKDQTKANYSFHTNCLCQECIRQMDQDLLSGRIDLKPN